MPNYETLNVKSKTKITITRLAKKYEFSLVDFVEDMANYFDKTGVNPKDMTILSPAEELKKFRDTIISFMRKQEKDFILPVFSRVDMLAVRLIKYIDEEAPKSGEQGKSSLNKSLVLSALSEDKKIEATPEPVKNSTVDEYEKLKNEHQKLEQKYNDMKKYFSNVLNNTKLGKTGFEQAPIINLPIAEINGYKEFMKKFL